MILDVEQFECLLNKREEEREEKAYSIYKRLDNKKRKITNIDFEPTEEEKKEKEIIKSIYEYALKQTGVLINTENMRKLISDDILPVHIVKARYLLDTDGNFIIYPKGKGSAGFVVSDTVDESYWLTTTKSTKDIINCIKEKNYKEFDLIALQKDMLELYNASYHVSTICTRIVVALKLLSIQGYEYQSYTIPQTNKKIYRRI